MHNADMAFGKSRNDPDYGRSGHSARTGGAFADPRQEKGKVRLRMRLRALCDARRVP